MSGLYLRSLKIVSRLAALTVAAVLVLAGCGAPDYGGYESDADNWPQSDPTSRTVASSNDHPESRPKSRLPLSLAGEPFDPGADSVELFSSAASGLSWDTGLYARSGGPFGLALMVYTGKPAAIDAVDSSYRRGGIASVGGSACGTYPGQSRAPFCWRSTGRQLVTVMGIGQSSDLQLARAVDEAWTYLERNS
jgi:hypothetical protein